MMEANLLNTEGTVLEKQNRSKAAEEKFRRSLEIRRRHLEIDDPNNEELANSYNNLGKAVIGQGRYEEALNLFQQAAKIDQTKPDHERDSIIYVRYYNICNAYRFMKMYHAARKYARLGLEVSRKRFGEASFYEVQVATVSLGPIFVQSIMA